MKTLLTFLFCLCLVLPSLAGIGFGDEWQSAIPVKEKSEPEKGCPVTNITDNDKCLSCHVVVRDGDGYRFGMKEVKPYAAYDLPRYTKIIDGQLFYYMENIDSEYFEDFINYAKIHPEFGKHLVVEIDSYGGGIFDAWRIKAFIVEMESNGYVVETRTRGIALSAGFIVFVSGTRGYRLADANAEFMMHELWTIEWPKLATPATKEEEAKTFRHLQDNINKWIASRGDMTEEEISRKVKFKEAWLTGSEMIKYRFADRLITERLNTLDSFPVVE